MSISEHHLQQMQETLADSIGDLSERWMGWPVDPNAHPVLRRVHAYNRQRLLGILTPEEMSDLLLEEFGTGLDIDARPDE